MISVIITAAGTSSRFGQNKQLFPIQTKKTVIEITVSAFDGIAGLTDVYMTVPEKSRHLFEARFVSNHYSFKLHFIKGGETRALSVKQAVEAITNQSLPPTHIMIHDGARPYVTKTLINQLIKASQTHKAVIPGLPMEETIKTVHQNQVQETLPRDQVWRIQTPQVFDYHTLIDAYKTAFNPKLTDEASLIEATNTPIYVIQGDKKNIKITTQDDI